MLDQNIASPIAISVDQPSMSGTVQAALDTFAAKRIFGWVVSVPDRHSVTIQKRGNACVRFLLLRHCNPVTLTEALQLAIQRVYRDLGKVLIVAFAQIDPLLEVRVVTHNNFANAVVSAPIDNVPSRFIQVVVNPVVTVIKERSLAMCQRFDVMPVLFRLQTSILLVVPLVERLQPSAVDDERLVRAADTGSQVLQTKVNAKHSSSLFNLRFWRGLIDIRHIKESRTQFGQDANLFNRSASKHLWNLKAHLAMLTSKGARGRHGKQPVFLGQSRCQITLSDWNNQQEMPVFGQVMRHADLSGVFSPLFHLKQLEERTERTVNNFQGLLGNISCKHSIVFITLGMVVIALIAQIATLLKEVLTHVIQPHIEHIFVQMAKLFQDVRLCWTQIEPIGLSQKHNGCRYIATIIAARRF